jgi:xanthine/uracil/vitamin C permease (AzgA family)
MTSTHETRTSNNTQARRMTTSSDEGAADRSPRRLLGLTSALLALQVLNLAVFDDLRTDESVGVLETFTKPQHLSSIVAVLLAVVLVARRHRLAARVAVVVAWIEIAAFTFFHGIPVQIGPAKPYWGDGSGDVLQWFGFLSIMACSAAIVVVGRRRSSTAAATPTTSKGHGVGISHGNR